MKIQIAYAALMFSLLVLGSAPAQTQDVSLNTSLLPNTQYSSSVDVTTSSVSSLLTFLQTSASPVQILDASGNVLGELPAQDVIDALQGLTGPATRTLQFLVNTGEDAVVNPVARILDNPLISVGTPTFTAVGPARPNQRPTVTLKKRSRSVEVLKLKGSASDDQSVQKVVIKRNGHNVRVNGTTSWKANVSLRSGRNRIIIQSVDNSGAVSDPKKITVRSR